VSNEYPGKGRGVLQILRSPWNRQKTLLLVVGSDERGLVNGLGELYYIALAGANFKDSKGKKIAIKGIMQEQVTSWRPQLDQCTTACYFIERSDRRYYLTNLCSYLFIVPGEKLTGNRVIVCASGLPPVGKQVEVRGKIERRAAKGSLEKSPNASKTGEVFDVIVVEEFGVSEN
jgi:hypothetical protein